MNKITAKLYRDPQITQDMRAECLDYAMAFGCPLCGVNITAPAGKSAVRGACRNVELIDSELLHLINGQMKPRYIAVCYKCWPFTGTVEGILALFEKVNAQ